MWCNKFIAGDAIQCYICNSRRDSRCLDPFNATAANALDPISCASVMSTRRFITYFAKLLTTLGIPVSAEDDAYFGNKKYLNEQESAACQKVKIQGKQTSIQCRIYSMISAVDNVRKKHSIRVICLVNNDSNIK